MIGGRLIYCSGSIIMAVVFVVTLQLSGISVKVK